MEYIFVRKHDDVGDIVDVFCAWMCTGYTLSVCYSSGGKTERYDKAVDFSAELVNDDCEDNGASCLAEYMVLKVQEGLDNLFVSKSERAKWAAKFSTKDFADNKWADAEE